MALKLNPAFSFPSPSLLKHRSSRVFMASALPIATTKEVKNLKKPYCPPREVHVQVTHSMPPQKMEIFKSLEGWAEDNILGHLKPVEKCWQPMDYLPEPESEGFFEQVKDLRERCKELPDDYFVVLVGDMITEEALPTYQTMLNTLDGVRDETGASLTSWAIWTRAWTAEENRHGDLLNKYLYLSGRVDMKQIEKTIQYLIGSGMDPKTENNPYLGFIYTSFQERATFISHGNTARLAKEQGDLKLAQICGTIASDEKRHETAYTKIVEKLFEVDPDDTVMALADMMKKKISMPAHLMYDGEDDNLFDNFSSVAQRLGVYTAKDYADILEFLVGRWNIEKLTGLSGEGRKAQDFVCGLPPRIRRLEERAQGRAKKASLVPFSWIFHVNSFYELEPLFVDHGNREGNNLKAWCVGPLCLAEPPKQEEEEQKTETKPKWIQWLEQKQEEGRSVIYVAFGSQAEITTRQLKEIAKGLEKSEAHFLWVIRKEETEPVGDDGFEERVKGRGMVVREWVDQKEILRQECVRGFLSHCGWNSALESICAGVPILAWPMMAEQPLNARMIAEEIGVGLRVEKCNGFVNWEVLAKMVRELMDGESEVGVKVRNKAKDLSLAAKKAMEEEKGSSWRCLDLLLHEITCK